jgi:hypothetical protein
VREISSILIEKMRRIVILFDDFFRAKAAKDRVLTSTKNLKPKRFGYMLQFVAYKLQSLCDEVVFLGGCTTAIFIINPFQE